MLLAASGYQGRQVGPLGCYRLDELSLPKLWIENLETQSGVLQQTLTLRQVGLHFCPVLAHKVEQSAHLPLGLRRFPACLEGAEGLTRARVLPQACCNF